MSMMTRDKACKIRRPETCQAWWLIVCISWGGATWDLTFSILVKSQTIAASRLSSISVRSYFSCNVIVSPTNIFCSCSGVRRDCLARPENWYKEIRILCSHFYSISLFLNSSFLPIFVSTLSRHIWIAWIYWLDHFCFFFINPLNTCFAKPIKSLSELIFTWLEKWSRREFLTNIKPEKWRRRTIDYSKKCRLTNCI